VSRLEPTLEPERAVRRIEVITGAGGRRRWTVDDKARIVEETLEPGASVSVVARRHGLTPQQVFAWRREARQRSEEAGPSFIPAMVELASTPRRRRQQAAAPMAAIELDRRREGADRRWRQGLNRIGGDSGVEGDLVIGPTGTVRVMVATKPVDFRKGMEGLAALVREAMGADPFCGTVYVFRAKRADRVKLIFWDGTGMVLVAKRLEDGKFRWPGVQDAIMRLSAAELQALLEGLDWRRVHEPRQTAVPTAAS
jgi:transposase